MPITGFEDVDVAVMMKELFFAVPCLLVSLALWYFVLRNTDKTPVVRERMTIQHIVASVKAFRPIQSLRDWAASLTRWKWAVSAGVIALFFVFSLILKRNIPLAPFIGFAVFLGMISIFRVFKTHDMENMLLIIASGLIGSRHGIYFREFNFVYPVLSFVLAAALFMPGEIRASAREKKAQFQKKDIVVKHDRLVYYLPAGYLITTILYFLTSF